MSKDLVDFISKLNNKDNKFNLEKYVKDLSEKKLEKILREISKKYYNDGESLISDEIFDYIKDELKNKNQDNEFLNEIGAPIDNKNKVELPFYMGSLDKIKPSTDELVKFLELFKGLFVWALKLDGISGLLYINGNNCKLYTRGNGFEGQDISHLIDYLFDKKKMQKFLQKNNSIICIRGELIISKDNFKKVDKRFKNARNAVAGFVNAKIIDKQLSSLVDFVAYNVYKPELNQIEQFKYLENLDIISNIVTYNSIDKKTLTNNFLSEKLEYYRKNYKYEIDGVVVFDSEKYYQLEPGRNPSYGFAFKTILNDQFAEVLVVDVEWEISQYGKLKPTVKINPIQLVGVTVEYATGFHAKYIEDNNLGPGSIIKIIRSGDVIPHILEVIKPATSGKPKMPDVEYIWDKNHVNILLKNIDDKKYGPQMIAKRIESFFSILGVKYISLGIVNKLVENKYDNVLIILKSLVNEKERKKLYNISGFGETLINKIYNNLLEIFKTVSLEKIMAGSNLFDEGLGERKIKLIIKKIPNIIEITDLEKLEKDILDIKGFSDITTKKFIDNINNFKIFFNELENIFNLTHLNNNNNNKNNNNKNNNEIFDNMKIVFTGFRDKNLEIFIENNGGEISSGVSSKSSLLIYNDEDNDFEKSSKYKKAKELKVNMISKKDFLKKYK